MTQVWTWNDFRFVNDPNYGNNPIAGIPRHVLRTTLAYSRPDGLYLAPSLDWVPQGAYADYMHTLEAPGYALIGVQAGMKLPKGVSIYVDARNLTQPALRQRHNDDHRRARPESRGLLPGSGRSIAGGLRFAF